MFANTVAIGLFALVLGISALLYFSATAHRAADALELSRRLGPGEAPRNLVRVREVDALGRNFGSFGLWLHNLTLRAGSHASVGSVVVTSLLLSVGGVATLAGLSGGLQSLAGLLLGLIPVFVLKREAKVRARLVTYQLPDALDLMARALRSGHAFSEALRMAAVEMPAPIGEELVPAAEEHRLGIDLREILEGLMRRMPDSFEMRLFASSVLLHRETGGNLIEILEQLGDTVRERVVFDEKVQAMTAEVRMSALILELLPFFAAAGLSMFVPGYLLPLLEPGLGRQLLVFGLVAMTTGVLLMRRIARVSA
jgi:tight adherence protein B